MEYVASRDVTVDQDGVRIEITAGTSLAGISPDQLESLLFAGWAVEAGAMPPADVVETSTDEPGEDPEIDGLGLDADIVQALHDKGVFTVSDALEFLEESPVKGFEVIDGIGPVNAKKIKKAIGLDQ